MLQCERLSQCDYVMKKSRFFTEKHHSIRQDFGFENYMNL